MADHAGRRHLLTLCIIGILILLDQWTKALAVSGLKGQLPVSLIAGILELLYVENAGAAFGIMNGMRLIFVVLAPAVCGFLWYLLIHLPREPRFIWFRLCCILIMAGALGNWIDRIRNGYVVDFIYFKPIDFPVFNVADIYVTCASFGLVLLLMFYYTEEEVARIPLLGTRKTSDSFHEGCGSDLTADEDACTEEAHAAEEILAAEEAHAAEDILAAEETRAAEDTLTAEGTHVAEGVCVAGACPEDTGEEDHRL